MQLYEHNADILELASGTIMFPSEPHIACVLLLDTSGSMSSNGGAPIASLNKAIKTFKEQICSDIVARNRVDVAVVEFNDTVRVSQDFIPLSLFEPEEFTGYGLTAMGFGINKSIDLLKERIRFYRELGTNYFRPWIFMITDGCPTDDLSSAKERLFAEIEKQKLEFWALGVNGYDKEILRSLTKKSLDLEEADFAGIFDWLSKSMITISKSRVDEKITLPELPNDACFLDMKW